MILALYELFFRNFANRKTLVVVILTNTDLNLANPKDFPMQVKPRSIKESLQYAGAVVLSLLSALWLFVTGKRIR